MRQRQDPVVTARLSLGNWIALIGLVWAVGAAIVGTCYLAYREHDRKIVRLETQFEQFVKLGTHQAATAADSEPFE